MSPKSYKVVHEAADRFHVHDGETQFAVAKKGLSLALVKRIQSFAKGGEVVGMAEGGEVGPVAGDDVGAQYSKYDPNAIAGPAGGYPTSTPGGSTWWDKTKDIAGNVAQTGLDASKDTARALTTGPLMIANALADPNVKAMNIGDSIGSGLNAIGHAVAPNLVAEQKSGASEPKEKFVPRQPPPSVATPGAPRSAGQGGGADAGPSAYDKAQLDATNGEKEGLDAQAKAEADKAEDQGTVLKRQDLALADQLTQRHQMDADHKAFMDAAMGDYKAAQQEFSSSKIDPGRFWASRSTGEKMLGAIGLVLGSFGPGATNPSVDIINGAIARDIDAQKADLAKKGQAVGMQQNLLGIMREKYKDESMAQAAVEATMLQRAKVQLEDVAARAAGPEAQAKFSVLKSQLDAALADKDATMGLKIRAAADEHALTNAKVRHLGAPASDPSQAGQAAIANLEAKFRAGHFTSPFSYENARKNAAIQIATAQNGGKLPRPATVDMILGTLPGWAQMTDSGAREKFNNARTTVRLGSKNSASSGGDDGDVEE